MAEYFDKAAQTWDESPTRVALAKAIAEAITKNISINPEMLAIEFGCGTGLLGLQIAPTLKTLTAIDNSKGMIEIFTKKAKAMKINNTKTITCDNPSKPPLNEKQDLVFTSMTMHHIPETKNILKHFNRWLKNNGLLAIADLDAENGSFHKDLSLKVHHGFDREQLSQQLRNAGFSIQKNLTVYKIQRPNENGSITEYPVFLIIAKKTSKL